MSGSVTANRDCHVDHLREEILWWNKFSYGGSELFHLERAGITYPHAGYRISRGRATDTFDRLYVMEYVVSGKGYIESEGLCQAVKAGDLYIIGRKTVHSYYADPSDPFEKKWLNISGQFLNAMMPQVLGDAPFAVLSLGEEAERIMDRIHARIKKVTPAETEAMLASVMKSLLDIFLLIERHRAEEQNLMSPEDRIVQYIEKNICLDINVSTICESFFISPSTLYRIFKERFGKSPKSFITEKKIEAAKRMIVADGSSVSAVASSLNFYDSHHFIRTFRAHTGMSPAEYRAARIKERI